jgi:hypothetical protein
MFSLPEAPQKAQVRQVSNHDSAARLFFAEIPNSRPELLIFALHSRGTPCTSIVIQEQHTNNSHFSFFSEIEALQNQAFRPIALSRENAPDFSA